MMSLAEDLAIIARIDAVPKILEVVCRTTGMGFAAVARVTEDRWVCCAVRDEIAFGLEPGGELPIETTICDEIRDSGQPVIIDHVSGDEFYCDHPTPKMYGFQSYISVPIYRPDGQFFGTLCAIDPKPARLKAPETIAMFKLFVELIAFHLDAQERLTVSEQALLDERQTAQLREQFIAVLGHDLRNPLNAINGSTQVLLKLPLSKQAAHFVEMIRKSSLRMNGLITNILDFARGRLGGGLLVNRVADAGVQAALEQIIEEMGAAWPDRDLRSEFALNQPIFCESARLAQLLSNLLANAISHGDPASPIWVYAHSDASSFELSVTNHGEPIPPDTLAYLFRPFSRVSARSDQPGLGLGLYIASEIARAHNGRLEVASSAEETRFTFWMPNAVA